MQNKKTLKEIMGLVEHRVTKQIQKEKQIETVEEAFVDDLDAETQAKMFGLALDMMQELCARKRAVTPSQANPEELAKFVAAQFAGVDGAELLKAYMANQTSDYGFTHAAQDILNKKSVTVNEGADAQEMALTQLHFVIYAAQEVLEAINEGMLEIPAWFLTKVSDVNYEMKDIHAYLEGIRAKEMSRRTNYLNTQFRTESVQSSKKQLDEKLNPSDPIKVWIDDFIKSKDPRFEGDSKKQRIQRAIASWYSARREAGLKTEDSEEELTELFLEKNSDVYRWDDVNSVMTKLNISPKEITRALVSLSPGKKDRHTWEELNSAFLHAGFKVPTILKILDKLKFYTLKEEMKDSEFDKIMVAIMNSPASEKFLDAVEAKNESAIRNLVKTQVKDASKIDEVVYRVMKG